MARKWMELLITWRVWTSLEDALARLEGVSLLTR